MTTESNENIITEADSEFYSIERARQQKASGEQDTTFAILTPSDPDDGRPVFLWKRNTDWSPFDSFEEYCYFLAEQDFSFVHIEN